MSELPKEIVSKIYGGILGKIAGVRLGMPIENMSADEIMRKYPHISTYLDSCDNEGKLLHPDDDINGFIFFLKVLEHLDSDEKIRPEHMASVILDTANDLNGNDRCFFWWEDGGAEKTAYRKLANGVSPEESGCSSSKRHCIGGSIFYDVVGLVFAGDVESAVQCTSVMAKVMHNGEGAYGGVFLNACISYAFHETDVKTVIEKALTHIPEEQKNFRYMVTKIIEFYEKNPYDWKAALHYAEEKWPHWYIWDYWALILISLLYGNGNFSRSLEICMHCGRDTDCTGGHVGAILGTLRGYKEIKYQRWVEPFSDTVFCSGALGYENEVSLTQFTARVLLQACKFGNYTPAPHWEKTARLDTYLFPFPYSRQNFNAILWRNHEKINAFHPYTEKMSDFKYRKFGLWPDAVDDAESGSPCVLKFWAWDTKAGDAYEIYRHFSRYENFESYKYGPSVCRHLLPGQTVSLRVRTFDEGIWCKLWMKESSAYTDSVYLTPGKWELLSLTLPKGTGQNSYDTLNLELWCQNDSVSKNGFKGIAAWIDDIHIDGVPDFEIQEEYSYDYDPYCVCTHARLCFGEIETINQSVFRLNASDINSVGMLLTGQSDKSDYEFHAMLSPRWGERHLINFAVQGIISHYAFGLFGENQIALLKTTGLPGRYQILESCSLAWEHGQNYDISVSISGNRIRCSLNGNIMISYYTEEELSGGVGFVNDGGTDIYLSGMSMKPLAE